MVQDIQEILIAEEEIKQRVAELGGLISRDYQGEDLVVVGILKGGIIFLADLVRHLEVSVTLDFIAVSSYGSGTRSSGAVRILKDLETPLEDKHVLIVEDIVDTGLTLKYLTENLKSRGLASLKICSFLDKPSRRQIEIKPDYCGFTIPDRFVVGYGLDFAERYRNLPYVAVLKPEANR